MLMLTKWRTLSRIMEGGIVAVLRGGSEQVEKVARAVIIGGIRSIEITMTVPRALDILASLKSKVGSDVVVGVGTVLESESAVRAIKAGADFIVSPHFDPQIINVGHRYQIPIIPGAMTITEITLALNLGCDVIKLFPAEILGPEFIKHVKGPLPHANLMPTGGVNESTIVRWIKAGAVAVGVGSELAKVGGPELDEQKIATYATLLINRVREARSLEVRK